MAKTESTAVNELIQLAKTATPLKSDPSEDLMFKAPDRRRSARPTVQTMPTRLTATIPPMRGAGEVAPLPRQRAPQGTQRGVPAINAPGASVRMSTAPSLPPLPTIPASSRPPVDVAPRSEGWIADRTTRPSLPSPRPSSLPIPQVADGTGQSQAIPPAPRTTRPSLPPPTRTSAPRITGGMRTVAPSTMPVVAPFEPTPPHATAMPAQSAGFVAPVAPLAYPSAAPYLPHLPNDMTSNQAWFDQQSLDTGGVAVDVEIEISGTARVTKTTDWKALIPRLIAPTAGLVILGVFVGGFFAFNGEGGRSNTASAAKTEPVATETAKAEPVAEPAKTESVKTAVAPATTEPAKTIVAAVVAPVVVPAVRAMVDIRIDSKPAGATVMLVDRGKTTFLGSTPISTAVDPSRQYDLVLTYADKPSQLEHIDPSVTTRLSVILGKRTVTKTAAVIAPKPETKIEVAKVVEVPNKVEAPKTPKKAAVIDPFETKPETKPAEAKPEPKPALAGDGLLMISSKPPCEIYVDGVPTGLSTPQRAMKLPAGKHKITLVNTAEKIKKLIPVTIGGEPTKVIENFMK